MATSTCAAAPIGVFRHDDHAELRPDGQAAREKLLDAIRRRVGRDVVIGRFAAKQNIAHAAADEVSLMARRAQGAGRHVLRMHRRVHCHTA